MSQQLPSRPKTPSHHAPVYLMGLRLVIVAVLLFAALPTALVASSAPAVSLLPKVYERLRKTDIPARWKDDVETAAQGPRQETIIPLREGALYLGYLGSTVAFVLLAEDGTFRDVKYFAARSGGFSVSWNPGLVVTLTNHPGTGMFVSEPMLVTVKDDKLVIAPADPQ